MSNYPQQFTNWFLDLIFPIRCLRCGKFGRYVCKKCLRKISIKKSFECIGCSKPTPLGATCYLCSRKHHIDQLLVVADYKNKLVQKSLKAFKYRFIIDISEPLLILIKNYIKWLALVKKIDICVANPLLVPVPLHKKRLNWRGFNQADILARDLAETYKIELAADILTRVNSSTPQADIKEKDLRLKNLEGVFKFVGHNKIVGREVVLIDDVCTTGATLSECAKVLKQNGATRIIALVIARG